jgi:N-acetylglutamate synthase-like GNAT family acetyltransferase
MCYEIVFAGVGAEDELRQILLDSDMDLAGNIEEHVLIKRGNQIQGGGMLTRSDRDVFHLLVFAVKKGERNKGIGSQLLNELIKQPWRYSRDREEMIDKGYSVTTVAKGGSVAFYQKNGFKTCEFSKLAYPFNEQCDECPVMIECKPAAMMFIGRRGDHT